MKLFVVCSALLLALAAAAPIAHQETTNNNNNNLPTAPSIVEREAAPLADPKSRSDVSDGDEHQHGRSIAGRDAAPEPGLGKKLKKVAKAPKEAAKAVKKGAEKSWEATKSVASSAAQKLVPDPHLVGAGPALGRLAWGNRDRK